jgi:hypothetical protein
MHNRGYKIKTTGWTPARVEALELMYCVHGYTYEECARALNVTAKAVIVVIGNHGMKLTPQAYMFRRERRREQKKKLKKETTT